MKKRKKIVGFGLTVLLLLFSVFGNIPTTAYAEEESLEAVYEEEGSTEEPEEEETGSETPDGEEGSTETLEGEEGDSETLEGEEGGSETLEGEEGSSETLEGEEGDSESLEGEEEIPEPIVQKFLFESELFETTVQGNLTISAEYDGAIPEVTFISPSGKEYSEFVSTREEFRYVHGSDGGWSNFMIVDAEAGMWSVRCYKTDEEPIEFFLARVEEGICIQEFNLLSLLGKEATVYFDVTKGEQQVSYTYSIGMVSTDGKVIKDEITSGYGTTGMPMEITFSLDVSSCKNAKLVLMVECDDEAATFDSKRSVEFAYENPDAPEAITGLDMEIDANDLRCSLDWEKYKPWGWRSYTYNVSVYAEGEDDPLFTGEELASTNTYFYYPEGTDKLEIVITYSSDGILSKEYRKELSLSDMDYIRVDVDDVTFDAMLPLEYSSKEAAELTVTLNDQTGAYRITGKDVIYFPLVEGNNKLYASFTGSDGTKHVIEKYITFVMVSPEITLYENLDGKLFKTSTVKVAGKTKNAVSLTINGNEVTLEADGSFSYDVPLVPGENQITVKATSESNIGTAVIFTVTRDGDAEVPGDGDDGSKTTGDSEDVAASAKPAKKKSIDWKKYLPFVLMGVPFVVLLLIYLVSLRKKDKEKKKDKKKGKKLAFIIVPCLLFALAATATGLVSYMYFRLRDINNSMEYVKMAEESLEKAANYLVYEDKALKYATICGYVAAGCLVLIPIGVLVRKIVLDGFFFFKKKKDDGAKEKKVKKEKKAKKEVKKETKKEESKPVENQTVAQPEASAETQPEVQAEIQPEVQAETQAEVQAETQPEAQAEIQPEAQTEKQEESREENQTESVDENQTKEE